MRRTAETASAKTIVPFAGRPLLHWTLDAATASRAIHEVVVATDDSEVARVASDHPSDAVQVAELAPREASDDASVANAVLACALDRDVDHVVLIHAKYPILEARHLDEAVARYLTTDADSLVSVTRQNRFFWTAQSDGTVAPVDHDPADRPARDSLGGLLVENGAFYITSRAGLVSHRSWLHGRIVSYEMPAIDSLDLDDPSDRLALEAAFRGGGRRDRQVAERLARIRLVITDVDGVITDGGMYYSDDGNDLKKFHARDGMGFDILRELGVRTGIITGKDSKIVARRAETLAIDEVHQGIGDKLAVLHDICTRLDIRRDHVAYLGDDRNDVATMRAVGFPAAPADAHPDAKDAAHYVCRKEGGHGCFREVADLIQRARHVGSESLDGLE